MKTMTDKFKIRPEMKTRLTTKQAARLLTLGVTPDLRVEDGWENVDILPNALVGNPIYDRPYGKYLPVFTLYDLLAILPPTLGDSSILRIATLHNGQYDSRYMGRTPECDTDERKNLRKPLHSPTYHNQLIDSLYETLVWLYGDWHKNCRRYNRIRNEEDEKKQREWEKNLGAGVDDEPCATSLDQSR